MAIGMTYEQYWYGDPLMVRAFYKAEKLRQRRIDEQAWLIGAYTVKAMNASVGNMFLEKGKAPVRYPEEPLSMSKEEHAKEKTAEQEELEKNYAQAYMMNMVMFGKGWEKKKKQEGGDVPWQMGQSTV